MMIPAAIHWRVHWEGRPLPKGVVLRIRVHRVYVAITDHHQWLKGHQWLTTNG